MTNTSYKQMDDLILSAAEPEWVKIAVIISKVFDAPGFDKDAMQAQDVAAHIYALIDNGQLEVEGNMRRWRDGAIRQPSATT